MAGIGPATSPLPRECSTTEPHGRVPAGLRVPREARRSGQPGRTSGGRRIDGTGAGQARGSMERETGIEPAPSAWKAEVLPLNYSRDCNPLARTAPAGVVLSYRCCLAVPSRAACSCRSADHPSRWMTPEILRKPFNLCFSRAVLGPVPHIRGVLPGFSGFDPGGGGWIRTNVGVSQQIYSLPPLATRAPLHAGKPGLKPNPPPCQRAHCSRSGIESPDPSQASSALGPNGSRP